MPQLPADREKKRRRNKNENILCAIIALMKELDKSGLEFVKMDATKRINKYDVKLAQRDVQTTSKKPRDRRPLMKGHARQGSQG